jgi:hypothetical protein
VTLRFERLILTMNSIAPRARPISSNDRFGLKIAATLALCSLLAACAGVGTNIGISVPIGRVGGVGVSVGSGGTVSGSVGVGVGGGNVSVGASGQLPKKAEPEAEKKEEKKP